MAGTSHSRAKSALGGHGHSGKPHSIHVKRAHSGGFIATHHHKPVAGEMTPEPEEHVIPDAEALQAHMQDQMGDQPPAPQPPPDPAAGAPAGAQPGM
jgi:hypothetical protein